MNWEYALQLKKKGWTERMVVRTQEEPVGL
jgi:hypothetical protein